MNQATSADNLLLMAAQAGNLKDIKDALERGANIDARLHSWSAVMFADFHNNLPIVQFLMEEKMKRGSNLEKDEDYEYLKRHNKNNIMTWIAQKQLDLLVEQKEANIIVI